MAFDDDDDDEETLHSVVSNYYFNDEKDKAVSFSELPLQLGGKETLFNGTKRDIFLRGTADDGLLHICKHVTAWKFDTTNIGRPEISVLSKESGWLKLQKPRKSFEPVIRSILITVHCLHLLSWNPDLSGKSLWEQLAKLFSLYEVKPSQNDLVEHMGLIGEAVRSDGSLAKSKFLHIFLEEKPRKIKFDDEDVRATSISKFIVDDEDGVVDCPKQDDSDDDEDELFDSVCAFCDNGGDLLCCEGKCLRSFHATEEAGEESECVSLGFTQKQVEAMQTFLCKNCEYNQHQCFACGKLGSSDKSAGAEVFRCGNATCGRFYHPHCVATLLHKGDKVAAEEHGQRIAAGEFFTCPIHKCCICQQGENKKVEDLQLALCRRCPTSYHRKCLPREIAFDEINEEGITMRAWDGLHVNRVLIYCLKHEILDKIKTPKRDHVKFPIVEDRKFAVDERKKRKAPDLPISHEKVRLKKRSFELEDSSQERTAIKAAKQLSSVFKDGQSSKKTENITRGTNSLRKAKATGASIKPLKVSSKSVPKEMVKSSDENKISLGERLFAFMTQENEQVKPGKQDMLRGGVNKTGMVKSTSKKLSSGMPSLDADSERRLLALMKEAESSITLDDIIAKHQVPSTHAHSSKSIVDRTITHGKIEGSVQAVRVALTTIEDGGSIEDAQAVCEPEVLNQIFKWQNKLRVYLSPFLYGMRYTSFGRHFTKVDKLKEIADRLHWYVQDGDMIVDFCCGANDFSLLMKRKLEETGKKCSYKNYDILGTKNDFNLEIRDWMSVKRSELPKGSKLIMGLNPPFGVKAALANKFIDKALEFDPKLLILIVPPETERLDRKRNLNSYELVWEDNQFLSGKSFYLPGSVDANDKQMDQWNVTVPPLYLWSRSDFAAKHKSIAEKHGHLHREPKSSHQERTINEIHASEPPLEDDSHSIEVSELKDEQNSKVEELMATSMTVTPVAPEGCSTDQQDGNKGKDNHGDMDNMSKETLSKKMNHSDENNGRGTDGGRTPINDTCCGIPHSSPSTAMGGASAAVKPRKDNVGRGSDGKSVVDGQAQGGRRTPSHSSASNVRIGRSSVESVSSKSRRMPLHSHTHTRIGENVAQHPNPMLRGSEVHFGTSYGDTRTRARTNIADDVGRRYSNSQPHSVGGAHNFGYRPHTHNPGAERLSYLRSQVWLYGQEPDVSTHRNSLYWLDSVYGPPIGSQSQSAPSYGNLGATTGDPSYRMNRPAPAMYRYTPRLDELHHKRMDNPGPGPEPPMTNGNGFYDPRGEAPRPPFRMGFAPGPFHPYPHHSSGGWLDE